MRTTTQPNRVLLLILVLLVIGLLVLSSALTLLPAPPGYPTPTPPTILDRPDGKPRMGW